EWSTQPESAGRKSLRTEFAVFRSNETEPAEAAAARPSVNASAYVASRGRQAIAAASAERSPATTAIASEPFATPPAACSSRKTPSRNGESCLLLATAYGASGTRAETASSATASRQVASFAGKPRLR